MTIKIGCLAVIVLLSGCAKNTKTENTISRNNMIYDDNPKFPISLSVKKTDSLISYNDNIRQAASHYGIDATLIKAIIQVESGFNPSVVSRSNAVGLMQLKASTAGRDAYRLKGLTGQPSSYDLKNPALNIDLGTAYINVIQKQQLAGIKDPQTLRYATIVAYVNGAGAMLRIFAFDKNLAFSRINKMNPHEFYQYIQKNHPNTQAPRYLSKVTTVYQAMLH